MNVAGSTLAGNFVGLYWQYGTAHPIPAQTLACRPSTEAGDGGGQGAVSGHGFDDVGSFTISGTYSSARVALSKQYIRGTGNPRENKGHVVELRLQLADVFASSPERAHDLMRYGCPNGSLGYFGSWHVRTSKYRGDAEMVLWLPPVPVAVGYLVSSAPSSGGGNAFVPVGLPEDELDAAGAVSSVAAGVPMGLPAVHEGGAPPDSWDEPVVAVQAIPKYPIPVGEDVEMGAQASRSVC